MNYISLARLFYALAEALGEPITFMPGLSPDGTLRQVLPEVMPDLPAEGRAAARRLLAEPPQDAFTLVRSYRALNRQKPPLHFYQSLAHGEHLLGPTSQRVRQMYARAGFQVAPEELPDHVSVELAFLGAMLEAEAMADSPAAARRSRRWREAFLRQEALTWLPKFAHRLQTCADPFYALVGLLLQAALETVYPPRASSGRRIEQLPVLSDSDACYLCGFCVRTCPRGALHIREDSHLTRLVLIPFRCTACGICLPSCPTQVLGLSPAGDVPPPEQELRSSPRARCHRCGAPTVSQAELDWVSMHLENGYPNALQKRIFLCPACK